MDAPLPDGRIARSRAVSAELEDIFRTAPPPAAVAAGGARVHRFAAARTAGGRRAASWGAMAAAAFVGVAGGALMTRTFERPAPPPPRAAVLPVVVASAAPPAPATTLVPTLETPAPQVIQAVERTETPKPKPRPAVKRSKPRRTAAEGGPCGESCSRDEVLAADRRLRAAYSRAVEAGVSRGTLVAYRNRWNGLRRYAVRQPRRMVSGYVLLANDLKREARLARRRT